MRRHLEIAVVTGAARGIGEAIARRLAAECARVDARLTFRGSLRDGGSAQPTGQGVRGEVQENPLAELLDGRQPMRTFGGAAPRTARPTSSKSSDASGAARSA